MIRNKEILKKIVAVDNKFSDKGWSLDHDARKNLSDIMKYIERLEESIYSLQEAALNIVNYDRRKK